MATSDGHVLIDSSLGTEAMVACSRLEEVGGSIHWHAELASRLRVPTEFRLLNPPGYRAAQNVKVGLGDPINEMKSITNFLAAGPTGRTPLCAQIREVHQEISSISDDLRRTGKKALVVIASDGAATDGSVSEALRPFQRLPVWIVIKLCTDDNDIIDYWNKVDEDLELDLDVLDDLSGEAAEVVENNPWLNYGVNLHKLREWGTTRKEFDRLDSDPYTPVQIQKCLQLIFGDAGEITHPVTQGPEKFLASIDEAQGNCPLIYDVLRNRKRGWVDKRHLKRILARADKGGGSCCTVS